MTKLRFTALAAAAAVSTALAGTAAAQTGTEATLADAWAWRATLYAWFPTVHASAQFPVPGGGTIDVDVNPDKYLTNLQFAFMGTLEARKGPWSFVGDAIYLDFGKSNSNLTAISGPGGMLPLPAAANVDLDLKGFAGALLAGYALAQTPGGNLDLVGGARYLTLKATLAWSFTDAPPGIPPQGSRERSKDFWDGVVGLRGKSELGDSWFLSYYADIGAGSSQSTWQAFAGVGYHFKWGDALIGYRHLAYNLKNDNPVSDLAFGGPLIGVGFNF